MSLIETFVRNPVKVSVGVLLVALFGVLAMYSMPMALIPEVQTPTLTIDTIWPGASPQEVERVIVQEQEKQLKSVEGVYKMTSESMDSLGRVTLEFPVGTDMSTAEIKVNSRLQQVPFYPVDVKEPVITTSNAADRPIAWFILLQRSATAAEVEKYRAEHPELATQLDHVLRARSDALRSYRLRKLAAEHPEVEEIIPQMRKAPAAAEIEGLKRRRPELATALDEVLAARTDGRKLMLLKRLSTGQPEVAAIMPPDVDVTTLRKFAEDFIEARFETVPGVSNSNVLGGREEEVQVIVDPEKLAARQLTIDDLRAALRGQNKDTSGGDFWELKRRYSVRTLGQFRSPEQVESVIVARRGDAPIYVRDVARVVKGHKKPDGFVARFGEMSIAVNAQRAIGANILDVMDGLRRANAELNDGRLKQAGLELVQVYDETEYIYSARGLVVDNLIEGAVLTFFTLLLFLRNGRSTIIIFVHILVSTIGAFLMMKLLDRSLNVPALGGLAFAVGMLVDNAIVMLENIFRRHQLGEPPVTASVRGAAEVTGALLNATLANLAVFLPVLFIKEEAGQLFRDIAIAISASVGLSMLVAVTVVPTATMRLLKSPAAKRGRFGRWLSARVEKHPHGPLAIAAAIGGRVWRLWERFVLRPLDGIGSGFVDAVVAFNAWVMRGFLGVVLRLAMIALFVGGGMYLSWKMLPKVEYLPTGNRNLVMGILLPPPGYNLNQLKDMGQVVESELLPYWDVDLGTPEAAEREKDAALIGDFFFVARARQVFIGLRAEDPMQAAKLIPLIQRVGARLPGTFALAKQSSLFEQALTGGRTIDVEITGPDLPRLVALGTQVLMQFVIPRPVIDPATGQPVIDEQTGQPKMAQLIPGAQAMPQPSLDLSNPEVHVIPKWEQAADLHVSADALGYAVDALVDGAYATDYYSGGDRIDLRIMGEERFANRTQDLESLPIAVPGGQLVPLSAIAEIHLGSGPEQINHRTRQRSIRIQVSPPPEVPLETAMEIIDREVVKPLEAGNELDGGYRIELAGTADKLRSTWTSLRLNFLLAVIITYLFMAATFESWLYPLVVMMTVPLGAVGGFVGLWMLNYFGSKSGAAPQSLDVLTMLGFFMLVGTVVNNPILIVEQAIANMRDAGMGIGQAILDSLKNRIRPIFMTTLSGLVGLLPLVIAPGAGSELYRGIGAVLLGGMVVSTVVTLAFVPAVLSLMLEMQRGLARLLGWRTEVDGDAEPAATPEPSVAAAVSPSVAVHGNGQSNGDGNGAAAPARAKTTAAD